MILTQNYRFGKFGPKTEMYSNFHEIWHLGHFKISFNNVTNFIKGLRNVKTLKNVFFSEGYSVPSQTSNKEFLEKNMFNNVLNTPLYNVES